VTVSPFLCVCLCVCPSVVAVLWQESSETQLTVSNSTPPTNHTRARVAPPPWIEQPLIQSNDPLPAPHTKCYRIPEKHSLSTTPLSTMLENKNRHYYLHWPAESCLTGFKYISSALESTSFVPEESNKPPTNYEDQSAMTVPLLLIRS